MIRNRNQEMEIDESTRPSGTCSSSAADQLGLWECWICKKQVNRRQRLESHMCSIHGLTEYQCKKRYKLYETNPDVQVPRTTLWRRNVADNQLPNKSLETSFIDEKDQNTLVLPVCDAVLTLEPSSSISSSEEESSDTESSCGDDLCVLSESDNSDTGGCDILDSNADLEKIPLVELSDSDEKCLTIWSYILKHRLTTLALKDCLTLFPLVAGFDTSSIELKDMNKFLENVDIKIHDVCDNCDNLFADDKDVFTCLTPGCKSLRYKGSINAQPKQKHKKYFATLSVEHQLIEILSRPGMWEKMESYQGRGGHQHNNSVISDIIDGEAYKQVLMSNNDTKHTFTLSMNTDGALLYSSSHVDLWPVFLVINELPPKLRHSRINMVTWGLWQTSSKPNLSTYLIPLCQELINLKSNGFSVMLNTGVRQCKAILILAIVDLMAKAPLLGMAYHNGNYGCSSCEEPGQVVNSGKGTARSYPPKDKYELRDTTKFLHTANKVVTTRTEELGIKTLSPLLSFGFL